MPAELHTSPRPRRDPLDNWWTNYAWSTLLGGSHEAACAYADKWWGGWLDTHPEFGLPDGDTP